MLVSSDQVPIIWFQTPPEVISVALKVFLGLAHKITK